MFAQAGQMLARAGVAATALVMTVETTTANETFTLRTGNTGGTWNATIQWGDGQSSSITSFSDPDLTHTYASAGVHTISITGSLPNIQFNNTGDKLKVRTVESLGHVGLITLNAAFYGCTGMTSFNAGDCDLSAVTSLANVFRDCTNLASVSFGTASLAGCNYWGSAFFNCSAVTSLDLSNIDFSLNTNFSNTFRQMTNLTSLTLPPVVCTSLVNTLSAMFMATGNLTTLDVSGWNTSGVTVMANAFRQMTACTTLDVSGFNVEAVTSWTSFMLGTTMSTAAYDATLIAWAAQNVVDSQTVDFGGSKYTAGGTAAAARADLIATDLWSITDGGSVSAGLNGLNTPIEVIKSTSNVSSYSGTLTGVQSGELTVFMVGGLNDSNGQDPSTDWTVTIGGVARTHTRFVSGGGVLMSAGLYVVEGLSGDVSVSVVSTKAFRALTVHAFRITGHAPGTPIAASGSPSNNSNNVSTIDAPSAHTPAAAGNGLLSASYIKNGTSGPVTVGGDGVQSLVGQTGSNTTSDLVFGIGRFIAPDTAARTITHSWPGSNRVATLWCEIAAA